MFIDTGKPACGPDCSPACGCGKYLEIWNDVFMEYNKQADGTYVPLEQKNVDTGMGLDRTIAILQGKGSVYETDVFAPIIAKIEELSGKKYEGADEDTRKAFRIVADHVRCATFMIGDERGITPSNVDQGYVLRRLLRRAIRFSGKLGIAEGSLPAIAKVVIDKYAHAYEELRFNENKILAEIAKEEERFQKTITQGLKEFEKTVERLEGDTIDGKSAFRLYDTFGFPIEFTLELAAERGLKVDKEGFDKAFEHHQELSHAGAEQRFKGCLLYTSYRAGAGNIGLLSGVEYRQGTCEFFALSLIHIYKLVSFHEYSREARFEEILGLLAVGKKVALVSDAGTPVISDPGYELVRRCIEKGIEVESIPGACAAVTAVTLSGMDCSRFLFWGFLSPKQAARRRELEEIQEKGIPCVVYESPCLLYTSRCV